MSRLLTQEEVDALLASFDAGEGKETPGREVPYDLRAPMILAGERLAMVLASCDRLARHLGDVVTSLMAADRPVRGTFTGLVQQPAATVLATLSATEPVGLLLDEHGEAVGGLSFQTELGLAVVDRLLGGSGAVADRQVPSLSIVETRLLGEAMARVARHLDQHTVLAPVRPGPLETAPVFGKLAARGGTLATAMFRLATPIGDAVCRLLMTPVLANRLLAEEPDERGGPTPPELERALDGVPVRVAPVVHGATLRMGDVKRLRPGQIVQLDVREEDPLAVRLNGELLARGQMRSDGRQRWFEIREFVRAPAAGSDDG
ncbi:MAG: hypothetical protein D6718_03640 [Acidobacteria bacterium]|nr:MAG: hypothetical protein D6718_03640 [Acidobacteriota bacterium]